MALQWKGFHGKSNIAQEVRRNIDLLDGRMAASSGGIPTVPAAGNYPITNLFVDSGTGNLQVEYDDQGGAAPLINSFPTGGNYAVTNLYVNAATGKLVVEYDDGN